MSDMAKVYPFFFRGDECRDMRVVIIGETVTVEEFRGRDALGVERWHAVDDLTRVDGWHINPAEWVAMVALAVAQGEMPEPAPKTSDQHDESSRSLEHALPLDHETMSAIMDPCFPRFGISPCASDADVIPEVLSLGLSSAMDAAAIVWHLAQGRPDQQALADRAHDLWIADLATTAFGVCVS